MSLEMTVAKHSDDIHNLTIQVTKLAGIADSLLHQRADDTAALREVAANMNRWGEKVQESLSLKDNVSDLKADIRALKHDYLGTKNTAEQTVNKIDSMIKDAAANTNDITAINTIINENKGRDKANSMWRDLLMKMPNFIIQAAIVIGAIIWTKGHP